MEALAEGDAIPHAECSAKVKSMLTKVLIWCVDFERFPRFISSGASR